MRQRRVFQTKGPGATRRAWLLLVFMLPYVLLGMGSDGLHTEKPGYSVPVCALSQDAAGKIQAHKSQQARVAAARWVGSDDSHCLSCQWNASSAGIILTLSHPSHGLPLFAEVAAKAVVALTCRPRLHVPSRGPPPVRI